MAALQKVQLVVALGWLAVAMPVAADDPATGDDPIAPLARPGADVPQAAGKAEASAERLDRLFAELAEPGQTEWERIEGEIGNIWSRSGSPAMDLLLSRGSEAMSDEDYTKAVEHFSALIDHAPEFAEGWNARATAYFLEGNYALAMADVQHVLALNPRHFGALTGLSTMFESMNEPQLALKAMRMAEELSPNRPSIRETIRRLEKQTGEIEL